MATTKTTKEETHTHKQKRLAPPNHSAARFMRRNSWSRRCGPFPLASRPEISWCIASRSSLDQLPDLELLTRVSHLPTRLEFPSPEVRAQICRLQLDCKYVRHWKVTNENNAQAKTGRKTHRKQASSDTNKDVRKHSEKETDKQTDRQTNRQTGGQADRQAGQAGRQANSTNRTKQHKTTKPKKQSSWKAGKQATNKNTEAKQLTNKQKQF